jgi:hypothetical protein
VSLAAISWQRKAAMPTDVDVSSMAADDEDEGEEVKDQVLNEIDDFKADQTSPFKCCTFIAKVTQL